MVQKLHLLLFGSEHVCTWGFEQQLSSDKKEFDEIFENHLSFVKAAQKQQQHYQQKVIKNKLCCDCFEKYCYDYCIVIISTIKYYSYFMFFCRWEIQMLTNFLKTIVGQRFNYYF